MDLDTFMEDKALLHSSFKANSVVQRYIDAMQYWVIGCLHWSFDSKRYFGDKGKEIKQTHVVRLGYKDYMKKAGKSVPEGIMLGSDVTFDH